VVKISPCQTEPIRKPNNVKNVTIRIVESSPVALNLNRRSHRAESEARPAVNDESCFAMSASLETLNRVSIVATLISVGLQGATFEG
jgi:hypothetical protein